MGVIPPEDVEVLIVGGGPVGLATAIQLGRAGIRTLLLERRRSFSRHTKAGGIHARTMEIFRQWGVADRIRDISGFAGIFSASWVTRLNGEELGAIVMGAEAAERELFLSWSPELMALCGQDLYEPILAEKAQEYPSVEVRLGAELADIQQDDDGVTARYTDATGKVREARSTFAVAADGVRGKVRQTLGIGEHAEPSLGNSINVLFTAPLEEARAERSHGLFWVVNGRLLIIEMVLTPPGEPHFSKLLDLEMLVMSPGGKERTVEDYAVLLAQAGLRLSRVLPTDGPNSIIEAVKA